MDDVTRSPFPFQEFEHKSDAVSLGSDSPDAEQTVRIELGRTQLDNNEAQKLKQGSVVTLDELARDPVDILVNERLFARGEVLLLNDQFCVRISEILSPNN